ncbi:Peptide (Allatostatin/somatostatin) receptor [Fasciolopsis buskii]|uniref:Peptide (Allatostatin/somatostatin) receptor n=1 Tax=Fasciolopsis buskii TaxID=27845 RepID=A0A8E0S2I1_9TREM|nr:Peptide (Allatostatin/somatostatin) receptor [Fasciolopsis buski]
MNQTVVKNLTCAYKQLSVEELMVYRFRAYVTPAIIIFGLIGNVLVVAAFTRMQRKSPCRFNLYAIAIAVAHTTEILFNAFLDDFLGRGLYWLSDCVIYIKIDVYSESLCKVISYIPKAGALISTNLLVLFSLDRVLTVYRPLKFRGDGYLRVTSIGIISVYISSFLLYLPLPIQSGIMIHHDKFGSLFKQCQYKDPLKTAAQYTLYLHIFGSNILPSILVLLTNIMIFLKLRDLFRERRRMSVQNVDRGSAESRRILGHLCMTTTFSVITVPIIVTIILRQHADHNNYAELFPAYENHLVQLSKLFSSLESIYFVTEFPTFYIFLPMFRREVSKMCECLCQGDREESIGHLVKGTPRILLQAVIDNPKDKSETSGASGQAENIKPNAVSLSLLSEQNDPI